MCRCALPRKLPKLGSKEGRSLATRRPYSGLAQTQLREQVAAAPIMAWSTRLLRPIVVGSRAAAAGPRCFSRRLPPVSLLAREQSSGGAAPLRKVVSAATADGEDVKVEFADGATYIYHALWLRDACRDEELVKTAAGERILHKTPLETLPPIAPAALVISGTHCTEGGGVHMEWSDGTAGEFQGDMLRAYAPSVALCATDAPLDEAGDVDVGWLAPCASVFSLSQVTCATILRPTSSPASLDAASPHRDA